MMVSRFHVPPARLVVGLVMGFALASWRAIPLHAARATGRASRLSLPDQCSFATTKPPRVPLRSKQFTFLTTRAAGCSRSSRVSANEHLDASDRIVQRARPGCRFQARSGHRPASSFPDDDRFARTLQRRLGSALRLRNQHQPGGDLPDAGAIYDWKDIAAARLIWWNCDLLPRRAQRILARESAVTAVRAITGACGLHSVGGAPPGHPAASSSIPRGPRRPALLHHPGVVRLPPRRRPLPRAAAAEKTVSSP